MNKCLALSVVVLAVLAVGAGGYRGGGGGGGRWKCRGWNWWRQCHRWCQPIDHNTHYCCRPYSGWCCMVRNTHAKPDCSNGTTSFHPDMCSCNRFYKCHNGSASRHICAPRGAFDAKKMACSMVMSRRPAFCGHRPYMGMHIRMVFAMYSVEVFDKRNGTSHVVSFNDTAPKDVLYNVLSYFHANRQDFAMTATFNPVFWYQIQCINGVCAGPNEKWKFKVNGVMKTEGVSYVIAPNGAKIHFVLVNH